jgi:hypothetical protein
MARKQVANTEIIQTNQAKQNNHLKHIRTSYRKSKVIF